MGDTPNGGATAPPPPARFGLSAAGTNELMLFVVVVLLIAGFVIKWLISEAVGAEMYERVVIFIVGAAIGAKATEKGMDKGNKAAMPGSGT